MKSLVLGPKCVVFYRSIMSLYVRVVMFDVTGVKEVNREMSGQNENRQIIRVGE